MKWMERIEKLRTVRRYRITLDEGFVRLPVEEAPPDPRKGDLSPALSTVERENLTPTLSTLEREKIKEGG